MGQLDNAAMTEEGSVGRRGDGEDKETTEEQKVGNTAISARFGSFLTGTLLIPKLVPGTE